MDSGKGQRSRAIRARQDHRPVARRGRGHRHGSGRRGSREPGDVDFVQAKGLYAIQVGAYALASNAGVVAKRLEAAGFFVSVETSPLGSQPGVGPRNRRVRPTRCPRHGTVPWFQGSPRAAGIVDHGGSPVGRLVRPYVRVRHGDWSSVEHPKDVVHGVRVAGSPDAFLEEPSRG